MNKKQVLSSLVALILLSFTACAPRYYYIRPEVEAITLDGIIALAQGGKDDQEIIRKVDESGTVFTLRTDDILRLHQAGVSDRVIDHLITIKEYVLLAAPSVQPEGYPIQRGARSYPESRAPRSLVPLTIN